MRFTNPDPRSLMLRVTQNDWSTWLQSSFSGAAPEERLVACTANVNWLLHKIPLTSAQRRELKGLADLCESNNWI